MAQACYWARGKGLGQLLIYINFDSNTEDFVVLRHFIEIIIEVDYKEICT